MWLIIRDSDNTVVGTNYNFGPPAPAGHTIKEWHGAEPGLGSPDPTLDNPAWAILTQAHLDFDALASQADTEVNWLENTIPQIDTMDIESLRGVLLRLAQENLRQIKAWKYLFRRLT